MYVVQIVGPSGMVRYLKKRKMVESPDSATWYHHPSSARKARDGFMKTFGAGRLAQILDVRDPERMVG